MPIFYDLETTGLNQFHDKITEMCFHKYYSESEYTEFNELVNPEVKILDNKSLVPCEEGCLSIPGASVEVSRPDKIELHWLDLKGKQHKSNPEGLLAVCIQHEIDHLEGKLLVDYLSPLKRSRLKNRAAR